MIKKVDWDSQFFNLKIGSVNLEVASDLRKSLENKNQFDLVYIFSPTSIKLLNLNLMDVKVTYVKKSKKKKLVCIDPKIKFEDYKKDLIDYEDLIKLVYLSGHRSRFKKDHIFGLENFKKLYKYWIDKVLDNNGISKVLTVRSDTKLVGFLTLEEQSITDFNIGLLAVSPEYQGKQLGVQLIQYAENFLLAGTTLRVSTQEENIAANKLYQKVGFSLESKKFIYHLKVKYDSI